MAGALNLLGAFLGTAVPQPSAAASVRPEVVAGSQGVVLAALLGAIFWNLLTWYWGLPRRSSHAWWAAWWARPSPTAALTRRATAPSPARSCCPGPVPPGGFLSGYALMGHPVVAGAALDARRVNFLFKKLQILSSAFMATSQA